MRIHRRNHGRRRGFALLMVVMIVAVVGIVGVTMLNLIQVDLSVIGQSRSNWEANSAAMVSNFEFSYDQGTIALLPPLTAPVSPTLNPPAGSVVTGQNFDKSAKNYTAELRYLNWTPVADNGLTVTRGLLYELRTNSTISNAAVTLSQAESRSEVTFITTFPAGSLLPRRHAR